ncbi:DUF916 and DUF3324 domain-containing protein (plasmid) [Enterococcus gilvus]|uniref:DUF916 and DUF3324 domain-containing protein n=1 Tax=Enterococcus gilvus TaxID=160453 RepID=UPI000DF5FDF9|nr:DUF916 and DUF3324 domain-containing protein [Enterococcus gilvus]AXG40502.1 DUF916 and DUF3324 domain-containing protein [Enterococcus gilvus]
MKKSKCPLSVKTFLLALILCLMLVPIRVLAEDKPSNENGNPVGFTVQAIKPETQIDNQRTYFYFQVRPGEKQIVKAKVSSIQKEPVTVVVSKTNAYTNEHAEIGYASDKNFLDSSLKEPLTDVIEIKHPEITLEGHESKEIEIEVTPKKEFSGIKLGALEFSTKKSGKETKGIDSDYGYRIGMILSESAERYDDAKELNLVNVFPTLNRGKRAVAFNFQNPDPQINKNMIFDIRITKEDDPGFKKDLKIEKGRMAPNSKFSLMMNWGVEQIKAGKYKAKVSVVSSSGIWEWTENFEVSSRQANKINKEALFNVRLPKWVVPLIVALAVLWFALTGYLLYRRKKWKTT